MLAMRPGLAMTTENVHILRYIERSEIDFYTAENASWIDYADTWASK
jgi:hypothetical protein